MCGEIYTNQYLTNMHYSAYSINMWDVESSEEYDSWFSSLDEESKSAVLERVLLLQNFGPNLPRPYADVLHGSCYSNLKELRNKTSEHVLRVAYYFDPKKKLFYLPEEIKKAKIKISFIKI